MKAAKCPCQFCDKPNKHSATCHIYCEDYKAYSESPSIVPNPITPADSVRIQAYHKTKQMMIKKKQNGK